jgi:hypothetical protein
LGAGEGKDGAEEAKMCGTPLRDILIHNGDNLRVNFKTAMDLAEKVCFALLHVFVYLFGCLLSLFVCLFVCGWSVG